MERGLKGRAYERNEQSRLKLNGSSACHSKTYKSLADQVAGQAESSRGVEMRELWRSKRTPLKQRRYESISVLRAD